jgi:hypothetical protein
MSGRTDTAWSTLNRSGSQVYWAEALGEQVQGRRMSFLDIYLIVLFLALVGLLVVKFRG